MLTKFLNKLRRYKHRFLLKKAVERYLIKNNLSLKKGASYVISGGKLNQAIHLRKKGSDIDVFKQIFLEDEYQPLIQSIKLHAIEINNIIDLGANIGLSTIYFNNAFENAKIYCVEPDIENFKRLALNIKNRQNIIAENVAIWTEKVSLLEDKKNSFRGGGDWSKTFVPTNDSNNASKISGITIGDLIAKYNLSNIDLLKIDIEGAERFIFKEENNLDFLNYTKVIAIEIHDEFDIRSYICSILKKHGFQLFESGELTIGINQNLIVKQNLRVL